MTDLPPEPMRLSAAQLATAERHAQSLKHSATAALVTATDMNAVARAQGAIAGINDLLARLKR